MSQKLVISAIVFYQKYLNFNGGLLSALALPGGTCKYSPSCSCYTINVVKKFGVLKGLRLGFRRVLSCR